MTTPTKKNTIIILALVLTGSVCVSKSLALTDVLIDFENFDLGGQTFLDTSETLVFENAGGSGVTVTIEGQDDIRIYDLFLFSGDPNTSGQALIDMNWGNFNNPNGTWIKFSNPVSNFSLEAGDFGSDDDSPLMIEAFDAGGNLLGSDSVSWPETKFPPFALLQINVSNIASIHYSSGGSFANSTFIDNLRFKTGPPDCLTLDVQNLIAGQMASFTITGGTTGVRAVTVYGLQPGTTNVNNISGYCATFGIKGVTQSKVVGGLNRTFDAGGNISFRSRIPGNTRGVSVLFQSAMQGTCPDECISNLWQGVIQ